MVVYDTVSHQIGGPWADFKPRSVLHVRTKKNSYTVAMFSAARTGLLNTLPSCRYIGSSVATRPASVPWFVDLPPSPTQAAPPISGSSQPAPPIPEDAPEILKYLHSQLVLSPHLDKSQLVVSPAVLPGPGPALPLKKPQGRRKRGGTYAGETAYEAVSGGVWSWVVMSQVGQI